MKRYVLLLIFIILSSVVLYVELGEQNKKYYSGKSSYKREDWKHWIDEDLDGLNTRQEVLKNTSLVKPVIANGKVISGKWYDPYTGNYFTNTADLDIDHLVPLQNAYQSGGSNWSKEKKMKYANYLGDKYHLVAVSKDINRSKGSKSPVDWLPPNKKYQCEYVRNWYKIKTKWGLTIEKGFEEVSNRVCSKK